MPQSTQTTTSGLVSMPRPNTTRAPCFTGRKEDVKEFEEEFEELAEGHGLTSKEKVRMVVRYMAPEVAEYWKTFDGYDSGDFVEFKKSVSEEYPKADRGREVTVSKLEKIRDQQRKNYITTKQELEDYQMRFHPVATALKKKGCIIDKFMNSQFFHSLHKINQHNIL